VREYVQRPLVYVAGPYTNPDPVENVHKSVHAAGALIDSGLITPVLPHLTLLARCDAVFVLPGESRGVEQELAYARRVGLPIFDDSDQLYEWARQISNLAPPDEPPQ